MTLTAIIKGVLAFLAIIREWFQMSRDAEQKQAGRDEVSAQVNRETADAQDRMAKVPDNPSDDYVSRRMSDGSFLVGRQDNLPDDTPIRQGDTRQGACRVPTFAKWFKD